MGYLAKGRDYGKIACSVDRQAPAAPVDVFAASDDVPADAVKLAEAVLEPGTHEVALSVAAPKADGALPRISIDKFLLVSGSPWIREWQVIGPFPLRGVDDPDPCETDGYVAGKSYDGMGGRVTWQPLQARGDGFVPIGELLTPKQHARVYAVATIVSPADRETELLMGAVDGMKAYLNGKEVFMVGGFRPAQPDQHRVTITLRKGENTLLMKVLIFEKAGMYARFRDPRSEL